MPNKTLRGSRKASATTADRHTSTRTESGVGFADALERVAVERDALQCFRTIVSSARTHDAEIRRIAGIPGAQLWALSEIARFEGISVNALSERMALHQTTASNLVNALVERKLIRRVRDGADQRVVHLHVAAEGRRLLVRTPGPFAGLLVDALRNLDAHQLSALQGSLRVLVAAMDRKVPGAAAEPLLGV